VQLQLFGLPLATVLLGSFLAGSGAVAAQSLPAADDSAPAPRVLADWRGSAAVAIPHSKPSPNAAAVDLGAAPANQPLSRMILLLAPAPAQQQALAAELTSLQNPSSPSDHHWLSAQAFAQAYANNTFDVAAVIAWLESQGFTVAPLPAGLGWIEFSGTVAQVEEAFGAQIHLVSANGNTRAVLVSGITVPGALSPVVAGLVSLDGVLSTPALTAPQPLPVSAADLASLTSPANAAALTPQLAAQLLDVTPLAAQGVDGAGQTVAIVSRSNVNSADVAAFRAAFELPASPLQVSVNGPDPGLADDQAEATLAASWAGAAAPGAQILLAPAASTVATDGVDLSLAAIVDQDLANVVAVGYSACEAALSPAHQAFYSALYQQAAAEGITVIAAAGDGGAAACTPAGGSAPVDTGLGVNALASTPWNTVAGVAGYGAGGAAAGTSALTAWSPANPADPAYASGGGASTVYARQAWQPAPAELAASGSATLGRLLPDLALPTAIDSSANPGLAFCLGSSAAASGCALVRSGGSGVATAFFAGVAALINQKNGVQGNLAPSLYATSRAFNDVVQGTARLECAPGSAGCDASGLIGFAAGTGYDLATGLGVPDVHRLVTELAKPQFTGATPTIVLSISPVQANNTYNPSAIVNITAKVVDPSGGGIPTGIVALYNSTNYAELTPYESLNPSGSVTTGSSYTFTLELSSLTGYPTGSSSVSYNLGVYYYDTSGFYPTTGLGYLLSVTSEQSPTVLTITPSTNSPALGSNVTITVTTGVVSSGPPAGSVPPSGSVTLTVNGSPVNTAPLTTTGNVTSAVFTVPITSMSNSIVASYSGDSNYTATTTNPYILTASKAATTVTLTASSTLVQPGVPVTLTATVTPNATPASGIEQNPSGTVLFYSDGIEIGSATLSPGPGLNSSTATLTNQTLPNGANVVTAVYEGDSTYGTSTSSALTVNVAKAATSVVLTANNTTVGPGQAVILTATVTPLVAPASSTEQNPSGTVLFYNGTTLLGSAILTPVPSTNSSTATLITDTLPGGSDSITAVYLGDSTYAGATSNPLIILVQGFTLTACSSNPPTNLNIIKGGAGTECFVVTSVGGYTGLVQVICTVPTQDDMTCALSPQQVTPTATVTFVVQSYVTGGPLYAAAGKPRLPGPLWPQAAGGATLAGLVFFLLPCGRRARVFLRPLLRQCPRRSVVLLMLLAGLAATGIGCTSLSTTVTDIGTPLGVATLQVTATAYVDNAVVAQSLNFTVNVQPQ
jgi:subtilase family serine protease